MSQGCLRNRNNRRFQEPVQTLGTYLPAAPAQAIARASSLSMGGAENLETATFVRAVKVRPNVIPFISLSRPVVHWAQG
jgi:hypothetical protein